jgi:bifunctional DNA-binding transcriptional regulator/antitoxin component of YhaV-PrlF toxin-antitoxin module
MAFTPRLFRLFQITISKAVRDAQQWAAGQEFILVPRGKRVLVLPVSELRQLAGIVKHDARKDGYRDRDDRY